MCWLNSSRESAGKEVIRLISNKLSYYHEHHKKNKHAAVMGAEERLTFAREISEGFLEDVTFKLKPGEECSRQMGCHVQRKLRTWWIQKIEYNSIN